MEFVRSEEGARVLLDRSRFCRFNSTLMLPLQQIEFADFRLRVADCTVGSNSDKFRR